MTILTGATFSLVPVGSGALPVGTIFTVIDNTATGQISGTFANLADGATISAAGTNLKVSYHGGTGNDLTLTVVP
ncbi:MAG: hypothetical protein H0X40_01770 [Chthoniobacterales bacterium]|nr:hypothetical protein [Chthoniobacterales bacterium]